MRRSITLVYLQCYLLILATWSELKESSKMQLASACLTYACMLLDLSLISLESWLTGGYLMGVTIWRVRSMPFISSLTYKFNWSDASTDSKCRSFMFCAGQTILKFFSRNIYHEFARNYLIHDGKLSCNVLNIFIRIIVFSYKLAIRLSPYRPCWCSKGDIFVIRKGVLVRWYVPYMATNIVVRRLTTGMCSPLSHAAFSTVARSTDMSQV
jgi:hypothetical protein